MISQTAEYALRAVLCLAQHPKQVLTTDQVARMTRVPRGYLSKVLQALRRAGLVQAQRGIGGGHMLKLPLEKLSILHVVNAVDPLRRINACPLSLQEHNHEMCALHRRLDQAMQAAEQAFGAATLAELLSEKGSLMPLVQCEHANMAEESKDVSAGVQPTEVGA
jgi:Rrf2 family transcriptional regulator, nitric oxide-sensitive transcriptional repressor